MGPVWAIVVTHNRKRLLGECLEAIDAQSCPPHRVLVVDNASDDGTAAMVRDDFPHVEALRLPTNEGGAGGFHEGMKRAHAAGADWMWLMDDDTIPTRDALAELAQAHERLPPAAAPALLASKVVWRDGRMHPMNAPSPERTRVELAIDAAERGLLAVRFATFVSLLVHRRAVDRHGLPLKHFFVWSDDVEYTSRVLLSGERGYLVPQSVALHKTATAHSFASAPPQRFYFHVRNTLFMVRAPNRPARDRLLRAWILAASTAAYLRDHPGRASWGAALRGVRDGLRPLS